MKDPTQSKSIVIFFHPFFIIVCEFAPFRDGAVISICIQRDILIVMSAVQMQPSVITGMQREVTEWTLQAAADQYHLHYIHLCRYLMNSSTRYLAASFCFSYQPLSMKTAPFDRILATGPFGVVT